MLPERDTISAVFHISPKGGLLKNPPFFKQIMQNENCKVQKPKFTILQLIARNPQDFELLHMLLCQRKFLFLIFRGKVINQRRSDYP